MFGTLSQAIARPALSQQGTRSLGGDVFDVVGFVDGISSGQSYATIAFPVRFFERPNFCFGFELAENQALESAHYPTVSGVIGSWVLGRRGETGAVFYDGATVLIVASGHAELSGSFHYRFQGAALTGTAG